jgi:ribosome biogenesis GTPase
MAKPRKQRVEFRKNRSTRRRDGDLTRTLGDDPDAADRATSERISGKGDLTRKRTVVAHDVDADIDGLRVAAGETAWRGRVLNVHGLESHVQADDGRIDWVRIRDVGDEGTIQSIEPRHQSLSRDSRGRRHVIVANVDQMIIVGSAAQPDLKPGLIDRLIVAAESAGIRPLICLNKVDLVDPSALVPLAGVFARMGYPVVLCSTVTGMGVARLQAELRGRVTAVVGQSGVGKSSLLNVLDPDLDLRVAEVSRENEKGRHTTTTARLLPHRFNGWFVDTPGVRQFQPWQLVPAEVPSAFRDLRPIANLCRFPNCTHDHETGCAVKDAVADGLLDVRRWESCRQLALGDEPREEDE